MLTLCTQYCDPINTIQSSSVLPQKFAINTSYCSISTWIYSYYNVYKFTINCFICIFIEDCVFDWHLVMGLPRSFLSMTMKWHFDLLWQIRLTPLTTCPRRVIGIIGMLMSSLVLSTLQIRLHKNTLVHQHTWINPYLSSCTAEWHLHSDFP